MIEKYAFMIEKYAFITNANYEAHAKQLWPHAIAVGDKYRMVQFASINEVQLTKWVRSLGFENKFLGALDTIAEMESNSPGPFACNYTIAIAVVNHFNPILDTGA